MPKYTLKFESPKLLNELKNPKDMDLPVWHYTDSESTLVLDTDTWIISSQENDTSDKIDNWKVDESNYFMGLEEGSDIDFQFAVSMIGQICTTEEISLYLEQLKNIFSVESSLDEPDKNDNINTNQND